MLWPPTFKTNFMVTTRTCSLAFMATSRCFTKPATDADETTETDEGVAVGVDVQSGQQR